MKAFTLCALLLAATTSVSAQTPSSWSGMSCGTYVKSFSDNSATPSSRSAVYFLNDFDQFVDWQINKYWLAYFFNGHRMLRITVPDNTKYWFEWRIKCGDGRFTFAATDGTEDTIYAGVSNGASSDYNNRLEVGRDYPGLRVRNTASGATYDYVLASGPYRDTLWTDLNNENSFGSGWRVVLLDSGMVKPDRSWDYEGRWKWEKTARVPDLFFGNRMQEGDSCGHGTALASIINGYKYGIAQGATVVNGVIGWGSNKSANLMSLIAKISEELVNGSVSKKIFNVAFKPPTKNSYFDCAAQLVFKAGGIFVAAAGNVYKDVSLETTNNPYILYVGGKRTYGQSGPTYPRWQVGTSTVGTSYGSHIDVWGPVEGYTSEHNGTSIAAAHVSAFIAKFMAAKGSTNPGRAYRYVKGGINASNVREILPTSVDLTEPTDTFAPTNNYCFIGGTQISDLIELKDKCANDSAGCAEVFGDFIISITNSPRTI